jgi:hypothetical protein
MTGRDWFIVGVRLMGVWTAVRGTAYLAMFVNYRFGLYEVRLNDAPHSFAVAAAFNFLLAAYFLIGGRHLASLCYGREKAPEKSCDDAVQHEEPKSGGGVK